MTHITYSLATIAALARAGAVDQAWDIFIQQGYGVGSQNSGVQALLGRLLKARARLAGDAETKRILLVQAAEAYARAHGISPASYLAINAASLYLLTGNRVKAATQARDVLAILDAATQPVDTPYFTMATRAEALLLLRDEAGAQAAMAEAVRLDPDNWQDRAATLEQFSEILAQLQLDTAWLDALRAPAALHFAGHMAIRSGGESEAQLTQHLDDFIQHHRIGFAYGAAAAGADIIIAERILAHGGEVHLILLCLPDQFAQKSVEAAGQNWRKRYDDLLRCAASIMVVGDSTDVLHDPLATQMAGQVAMGNALIQAQKLATSAWQFLALDSDGGGPLTRIMGDLWPQPEQSHRLKLAREFEVREVFARDIVDPMRRLAAVMHIRLDYPADPHAMLAAQDPVSEALMGVDPQMIAASHQGWSLWLDDPVQAAKISQDLLAKCRETDECALSIGIGYGIVTVIHDSPSHTFLPFGSVAKNAQNLAEMAPAGTALCGVNFAAILESLATPDLDGKLLGSEFFHGGEGEIGEGVHVIVSRQRQKDRA